MTTDASPQPDGDDKTAEVRSSIQADRTRGRWHWIATSLLLVAAIAAAIWWFSGEKETRDYVTTAADRGDIVITATATGSLEPKRKVTVGAEISGMIEDVLVEQNDRVESGQTLARIDTTRLENTLAQAEASLAQARASLAQAQATLTEAHLHQTRIEKLRDAGSASQQTLEQARAQRKRAAAQVDSARATIRQASATVSANRTDIQKATIVSPVDGVVLDRKIEPGSTVAATFHTPQLFVLAEDLKKMELHLDVDEADIGLVEQGQSATFRVDAWPDHTFDATVELVALNPTVTNNVVTYTTILGVDNEQDLLRPGMTATATIETGRRRDVLRVPNTALRFVPPKSRNEQGGFQFGPPQDEPKAEDDTLYRLTDGKPEKVHVSIGRSDGRYTEIRSGDLQAGDQVVTGIREPDSGDQSGGPS